MMYVNEYESHRANSNYPNLCKAMSSDESKYLCVKIRDGFTLVNNEANKWFLTKKKEIVAMQYAQISGIYGITLKTTASVFQQPFNSSLLNVFQKCSHLKRPFSDDSAMFPVSVAEKHLIRSRNLPFQILKQLLK